MKHLVSYECMYTWPHRNYQSNYQCFKSIDLNARCTDGKTAFQHACEYETTDVVKLILDYHSAGNPIELPSMEEMNGWNCDDQIKKLFQKTFQLQFKQS